MSANALLLWMSAKAAGSWQQFRAAVEELSIGEEPLRHAEELTIQQLQRYNLQRLGHAEFFGSAMGTDWRVAPPTLAVSSHNGGTRGVLAGARSMNLLQRLHSSLPGLSLDVECSFDFPDAIRLMAPDVDIMRVLAKRVGLHIQSDAPEAILGVLPAICEPHVRRQADLPFGDGWRIDRFSAEDLRWHSAERDEALATSGGLFRFVLRHQRQFRFCASRHAYQVPVQVGKYLALRHGRRRRILAYDVARAQLIVPVTCRPPLLIERALVACSGLLPRHDSGPMGLLYYHDVPPTVAQFTAQLLKQDLQ